MTDVCTFWPVAQVLGSDLKIAIINMGLVRDTRYPRRLFRPNRHPFPNNDKPPRDQPAAVRSSPLGSRYPGPLTPGAP